MRKAEGQIVGVLAKVMRVLQKITMRLDLCDFGQRQLERRVAALERRARNRATKGRRR